MCCISCAGVSLSMGGLDHTIVDANGRSWFFENHRIFGPLVLRKDGEPKKNQPGPRSAFWPAFDRWNSARREAA